ncbi:uncharacterized protein O3C94_013053 [Discoglossus pictus]
MDTLSEEIFESLGEAMTYTKVKDRDCYNKEDDDNEEFFDASDTAEDREIKPCTEELTERRASTVYLDALFGPMPPASLITRDFAFSKPPMPSKKHIFDRFSPQPISRILAEDDIEDLATTDELEEESQQLDEPKKHYVRIGGMYLLPIPVERQLFSPDDSE